MPNNKKKSCNKNDDNNNININNRNNNSNKNNNNKNNNNKNNNNNKETISTIIQNITTPLRPFVSPMTSLPDLVINYFW